MSLLHQKIDKLYNKFSNHTPDFDTEACKYCQSEQECEVLQNIPIRELTIPQIQSATFNLATNSWGSLDDYKYFLPRTIELMIEDMPYGNILRAQTIFGGLRLRDWETWPVDEFTAVDNVIKTWWIEMLSLDSFQWDHLMTSKYDRPIHIFLESISRAYSSVQPFLDIWTSSPTPYSLLLISEILTTDSNLITSQRRLNGSFWSSSKNEKMNTDHQMNEIITWLESDQLLAALESALSQIPQDEDGYQFLIDIRNKLKNLQSSV